MDTKDRKEDSITAPPKTTYRTRLRHAAQLVVVCSNGERSKKGKEMDQVALITDGALIVDHSGTIVFVGATAVMERDERWCGGDVTYEQECDATGCAVLPGFCDGHTHPVWSGDRVNEFKMKLAGATYMDIHNAGGGIGFTVRHTRDSSEDELLQLLLPRMKRMLRFGTTLVEAKSGYGLELTTELKMLRVLARAQSLQPIDIVANYCGAHSVPKGSNAAAATTDIIEVQLPAIIEAKKRGEINPELIDVFCEKGVFELADTERILAAGAAVGLQANFHGDELTPIQAAEMGARMGARAVSHLEHISPAGMTAMATTGSIGVLLPTTAYGLRIPPPPVRAMIDADMVVALGSDFNPNAHCLSMPHVMNLACVTMRMTCNEALVAATINAAASLNRASTHGSLEEGKRGDFVMLSTAIWEHIIYEQCDPPIAAVFKEGKMVFQAKKD